MSTLNNSKIKKSYLVYYNSGILKNVYKLEIK